jgi:hypothetical protein
MRNGLQRLTGTVHMPAGRVWRGAPKTSRSCFPPTTMIFIRMHAGGAQYEYPREGGRRVVGFVPQIWSR